MKDYNSSPKFKAVTTGQKYLQLGSFGERKREERGSRMGER